MNEEKGKASAVATLRQFNMGRAITQTYDSEGYRMIVFDKVTLFTPLDTTARIRELRDEERGALTTLMEGGEIPFVPERMVEFDSGVLYTDSDNPFGVPEIDCFLRGIGFYIEGGGEIESEVNTSHPLFLADVMFRDPETNKLVADLHPTEARVSDKTKGQAAIMVMLMMNRRNGKNQMTDYDREVYGDKIMVDHHRNPGGFAKVKAAKFTGRTSMVTAGGDNKHVLRVYGAGDFYIMYEPGAEYTVQALTPEQSDLYMRGFKQTDFKPTHVISFPRAAFIDGDSTVNDPGVGTAVLAGDFKIGVEAGTKIEEAEAWAPIEPFKEMGYETYLEERDADGYPTPEEQRAALDNVTRVAKVA